MNLWQKLSKREIQCWLSLKVVRTTPTWVFSFPASLGPKRSAAIQSASCLRCRCAVAARFDSEMTGRSGKWDNVSGKPALNKQTSTISRALIGLPMFECLEFNFQLVSGSNMILMPNVPLSGGRVAQNQTRDRSRLIHVATLKYCN